MGLTSKQHLCSLIDDHPKEAAKILPLIAIFGRLIIPAGVDPETMDYKEIDFTWEREWRYACGIGPFIFSEEDVFVGLCPHAEIRDFEQRFGWLKFIDPYRNIKWYSEKLLDAKQRVDLKHNII